MKAFLRIFIFLFCCFILLNILIDNYADQPTPYTEFNPPKPCNEFTSRDSTLQTGVLHNRSWQNSKFTNNYCLHYTVGDQQYQTSNNFRNNLSPYFEHDTFQGYWGSIYKQLLQFESDRLYALQDSLRQVGIQDSLDPIAFADLVVSFVQDIPYSFIMGQSCDEAGDTPCLANQNLGLLSPVEFLYTLKGDCDTRTTLLYKLLKHFDYDVKVVISSQYAHAMIAINLPVSGDYLAYRGQRYYFWETTNIGWQPGMLSAEMKNINYWNIALN
jgi:hypothetical protein